MKLPRRKFCILQRALPRCRLYRTFRGRKPTDQACPFIVPVVAGGLN